MKKTVTFAVMHFSVAFMVAYLLTGSVVVGGAVALVEPAINTVAFYFHERVWKRIEISKEVARTKRAAVSHDVTLLEQEMRKGVAA
ncbi:DUF2061 domain-containing protein [Alteromonas sp. A079]|uniref:DUF2061 domain-containing protein n=1 Tax=Alteromonas sp. A079 TaxID=3410268 RepID=UPI003BA01439